MSRTKKRVAAVDGWFVADSALAHLVGSQCKSCGSYFFPKESFFCRNPACNSREFEELALSRTGTLWSFANNCYPPPPPYVAAEPFEPYIVAAVELRRERMVVLGQVVPGIGISELSVGMEMELVLDTLYEDDDNEYLVWKWRPLAAGSGAQE